MALSRRFFETDEERSYMTVILPVHKRFMAAAAFGAFGFA
jgi:hypothetical protein